METELVQSDTRLTDVHRKTIQKCRVPLVDDLIMSGIIDAIYSKGVITNQMQEEIMSKPTNREQSRDFLDKLLTRDVAAFDDFIDILKRDNIHLANIVRDQFEALAFSEATQHLALANKIDPKGLHEDNFAFAKKSVSEIVPMVQELKNKYEINGSDSIAMLTDHNTDIDKSVSNLKDKGLPQLPKVAEGNSENKLPSIPGVVAQPESTHLGWSESQPSDFQLSQVAKDNSEYAKPSIPGVVAQPESTDLGWSESQPSDFQLSQVAKDNSEYERPSIPGVLAQPEST
ncbi:unnamed protein product, partial [Owenia fusiformis]